MRNTQKEPLWNLRTMQVLISLRNHASWSGSLLPTYRINRYCSICWQTENVQIRLHGCTHSSCPSLFAHAIWAFIPMLCIMWGKGPYHICRHMCAVWSRPSLFTQRNNGYCRHSSCRCFFQSKSIDIFLFLHENICCGYSFEAPYQGACNEYPQHMSSLRNKKNIYLIPTLI